MRQARRPAVRLRPTLFVTIAASVAFIVASGPLAHAGTPCHERVLDEWIDTETVSSTYGISCYDKAIKRAPDDLRLYSSFEDDVLAAKSKAVRQQAKAASAPSSPSPAPALTATPPPPAAPPQQPVVENAAPVDDLPVEEVLDPVSGELLPELTTAPPVLEVPEPAELLQLVEGDVTEQSQAAPVIEFLRDVGPSDSRSIPVPLIVLTIVAGLLALGGAAVLGYRQYHARRYDEAPPLPPRPPDSPAGY